ncbi:MAG: 4Fe-4S dicluster domain-containing protein [Armatimonadetes bacterium]|nr:4Fe-4S dicluster domain-containing protein [Armatimonadota bacterium]
MSPTTYLADSAQAVLTAILAAGQRVVAPVEQAGLLAFAHVEQAEQAQLIGQTRASAKELAFPRTQRLFGYRFGNPGVELLPGEEPPAPTVLFGVRPCDAAGLAILDGVFGAEPADAPYLARRARITVVGLSCDQPQAHCACTAVGLSPTATDGSDLLLTPLAEGVLVEVLTARGAALVDLLGEALRPGAADKAEVTARAEAAMAPRALPAGLADGLAAAFGEAAWADAAARCLGCGTCAFVCPTCHCFDVVDESNLRGGQRLRVWDACQFGLFTLHASGHNPRADQAARYRQRALHKFSYYPRAHGRPMCVGCGRCVNACPAGMDIFEVAATAAAGQG